MPLDDSPASPHNALQPELAASLFAVRALSAEIVAPLSAEDMTVQANDDASPVKWHLAHTTWFFEELLLSRFLKGYKVFNERFSYCFNSYYESLGPKQPRSKRGLLTRPSVEEVRAYRAYVDEHLHRLMAGLPPQEALELVEIGLHHEQQHQELMLTDILALFAANPLRPVYCERKEENPPSAGGKGYWRKMPGGIYDIGHDGAGFAYDNECPQHQVFIPDFAIYSRQVTNGEWKAFIESGAYNDPLLWLSDGWAAVQREGWTAPGYWEMHDGCWHQMTLHGLRPVHDDCPVTHVSYYEADAFARWSGRRLPTEFEWEIAACRQKQPRPFSLSNLLAPPSNFDGVGSPLGGVWEWTQSPHHPYPGYKAAAAPLGEYNAKFMCNQLVLRGGSFATPDGHLRPTYRNFFYPHQRWQFTGVRLASDI